MLVLSSKAGEEIVMNNGDITISVLGIMGREFASASGALGNSRTSDGNPSSDHSSNQVRGGA